MPTSEPQAAPTQPQPKASSAKASTPKVCRWWRDYPLLLFFALVWLAPMFWMGMTKSKRLSYSVAAKIQKHVNLRKPILPVAIQEKFLPKDKLLNRVKPITWYDAVCLPREVTHLHNASCLFTRSVSNWSTHHVQGTTDNKRWFTLRDELYSPMKPFGHRARVDRFLADIGGRYGKHRHYQRQANEMCQWYRDQHAQLNPLAPPLVAVRLVRITHLVGEQSLAEPEGYWVKQIPEQTPEKRVHVFFKKTRFAQLNVNAALRQSAADHHRATVAQTDSGTVEPIDEQAKEEPCCPGL
jgi:hypothetical protein